MSLCRHGVNIKHRNCERCEEIAEAEHVARCRTTQCRSVIEYDDVLPVSLHHADNGTYFLLDRHNDELARFGLGVEIEDMERIVALINRKEAK